MCGATYFKPRVGIQPCVKCGSNSVADLDRKTCDCKTGYKRATKNIKEYTTECFSKLFYSILMKQNLYIKKNEFLHLKIN